MGSNPGYLLKYFLLYYHKYPHILHNLFGRSAQICHQGIIEKSPKKLLLSVRSPWSGRRQFERCPYIFLPYIHAYMCVVLQQTYMPYNYKVYTFTSFRKWPPFFGGLLYKVERNLPLAHTLHVNEEKKVPSSIHSCLNRYTCLKKQSLSFYVWLSLYNFALKL